MAQVIVKENESLESALKRFKRSCARDGVMAEVRKRETTRSRALRERKSRRLPERRRASTKYDFEGTAHGRLQGLHEGA